VTVASQARYTLSSQHKAIRKAHYCRNIDTETENMAILEIVGEENLGFIKSISTANTAESNYAFNLAGIATDFPKFLLPRCQEGAVILSDKPLTTGDTLRLYTRSLPSALAPGVTYDGDERDVYAIACKVAAMCRMKSRFFTDEYEKVVINYRKSRSKENQISQAQDARFQNSNLRSINGPV